MKFIFVSVATLLTTQAVSLNREAIARTAAQPGFADPYDSVHILEREKEVMRAQVEMGGPAREVAFAAKKEE